MAMVLSLTCSMLYMHGFVLRSGPARAIGQGLCLRVPVSMAAWRTFRFVYRLSHTRGGTVENDIPP